MTRLAALSERIFPENQQALLSPDWWLVVEIAVLIGCLLPRVQANKAVIQLELFQLSMQLMFTKRAD